MKGNPVYVSVDIETDGPCPGVNSMLSLGSWAFEILPNGRASDYGYFSRNLEELPEAQPDLNTSIFWAQNPEAYEICRKDPQPIANVMQEYHTWLKSLPGRPIFIGYPAGFDFTYVYWYLHKFCGDSPFGFSCIDIKSLVMGHLGTNFRGTVKKNFPKRWLPKCRHTHVALDDAIEQGEMFINIMREIAP